MARLIVSSFEKLSSTDALSPYSIVGYCTAYRFLTYQPSTSSLFTSTAISAATNTVAHETFTFPPVEPLAVSSLPNRTRISQFLILPPHQGFSHGTRLYKAAVAKILSDPACIEITVEDPNESFDDLRDFCDYSRLTKNGALAQIKLNTDLDPKLTARRPRVKVPTSKLLNRSLLESIRTKNKLAPRQFARLVEMHLLSQIPRYSREASTARLTRKANASDKGDKAFYYWRLLVKQRIYRQNKDQLMQVDHEERVEKLEETVATQWRDYERLLEKMEEHGAEEEIEEDEGARRERKGKRKIVDDEDEDMDEEPAKKARVEDA